MSSARSASRDGGSETLSTRVVARNRRARHDYHIIETLSCGIVLTGTEVKSIRAGTLSFADSYARVTDNELWLEGLHISEYRQGGIFNHAPVRRRKLLVKRREIDRLARKCREKGLTMVPLEVVIKQGLIKVILGLCQGKRLYDKRETLRRKDAGRRLRQQLD